MTTFRQIQDEVLQILNGYGLEQPRTCFLAASLSNSALSVTVDDASSVQSGIAEIEGEIVWIQSVDRTTKTLTFSADGRGYYGTTATAHASGTRVTINPTWSRTRVKSAINDIIVGTYPTLFGSAQAQFTFSPATSTYALPVDAEGVLSVTADTNGPSREQQQVRHYDFSSTAPTDDWPNTNTITIQEAVSPGRTVTVTYRKAPAALVNDGDALTTSGLRETAKSLVVYGACSQLVAYMDVARLPADTAVAEEYATVNPVGTASRISGQLYTRYQLELEQERKRLRDTTKVAMFKRVR
ncbi:MAG: phage adaptor protein [Mycobacteriaceae bacterium]